MSKSKKIGKILLALVGLSLLIICIRMLPQILELTVSIPKFRDFILSSGYWGPLVFIGFQILQTVIAPIPGEVVQIAGGYIYGVTVGTFYTTLGMLLGAVIAFYCTRLLGRSFIENLLKKKKFKWMAEMVHHKNFSIILFIFFAIPGLPKDLFIYLAALTPIKPINFFAILLLGRLPWILASASVGSSFYEQNYVTTIIISVVSVLAFALGLVFKDKIIRRFTKSSKYTEES